MRAGHDVVAVSRGLREPYVADEAWRQVQRVVLDRDALADAFPAAGSSGTARSTSDPTPVRSSTGSDSGEPRSFPPARYVRRTRRRSAARRSRW
ncbi:MAG TPA: hypothetical protein VJT31_33255 [Rugosimonospora sp.]|nr:hypothetical protein [Rugosimonospora sp.]